MTKSYSIKYVKQKFKEHGYVLYDTEYKNVYTKMKCQCKNRHIVHIAFRSIQNNHICPKCRYINNGLQYKHSYSKIKEEFEKREFKLLSTNYINSKEKLEYICPKGHTGTICYNNFNTGAGCNQCKYDNKRLDYSYIKQIIEKEGYKLLSKKYENAIDHLIVKCPKEHQYNTRFYNFQKGHRCAYCSKYKNEEICRKIMEEIFQVSFKKSKPFYPNKMELDGYNKEIGLAFEYNGEQHYYHVPFFHPKNEDFEKRKQYDRKKQKLCKENDITLIIIPYWEKDNLENFILSYFDF